MQISSRQSAQSHKYSKSYLYPLLRRYVYASDTCQSNISLAFNRFLRGEPEAPD